jgi:hypothetical protein
MDIDGVLRFDPVDGKTRMRVALGPQTARRAQAALPGDRAHRPTPGAGHLGQSQAVPGSTASFVSCRQQIHVNSSAAARAANVRGVVGLPRRAAAAFGEKEDAADWRLARVDASPALDD